VKGKAGLRIAGIMVMGLAAAGALTACGGDSGPATKSNADYLKDAVANMKAAKTYHMDADISQSGQQVKLGGDIDLGANNVKLSMTMAGQSVDVVKVGNDYFSSMDGGTTFTKAEASSVPDLSSFYGMWNTINPSDVDKARDGLKDGTPPTEQIDGTDTKHISGANKDLGSFVSGSEDGTLEFWVTTGDKPTVRQMKVTSSQVNGTFKWSKIDEPLQITAPPVSLRLDAVASR
jgi:hypothetical protein